MKRTFKFILIIAVFMLVSSVLNNFCYAANPPASTSWESRINTIISKSNTDSDAAKSTKNVVGAIITVTRTIATGVAIIMIIVLAMKYMMAAPGDRADIKKHAVVYIVGAVVLFASSGILGIIAKFAAEI